MRIEPGYLVRGPLEPRATTTTADRQLPLIDGDEPALWQQHSRQPAVVITRSGIDRDEGRRVDGLGNGHVPHDHGAVELRHCVWRWCIPSPDEDIGNVVGQPADEVATWRIGMGGK